MRRGAKPAKAKGETKLTVAGKSRKSQGSKVRDLEKRLAESLEREKATAEVLQEKNRALTEALGQQAATREILRVISGSPTDVQPSFDAIAAAAATLCAAQNAGVFLFDGTLIHLAAHHHWTAEDLDAMQRTFPRPPGRGSITARAILSRAVAHVRDITEDPEYDASPILEARVSRATLSVPMLRDGHPIGAITVARREAVPFTDAQIALLETFARQAVIAIENVRLFKETKEALEQQTATSEILRVISQSPTDVQPVFDAIAENMRRLFLAWYVAVYRLDGEFLQLVATRGGLSGPMASDPVYERVHVDRGSLRGRAILDRALVHVADVTTDRRATEATRRIADLIGWRSVLITPMLRDGGPIGLLVVTRAEPGAFSDNQIALLQTFAGQAVIAIENVRLFKELEARNRDLTATGEILQVISRSPTDVQPVFDTIAESALRLCGSYDSALLLLDGQHLRLVAHDGPIPSITLIPVVRGTVGGRSVLERQLVHVADVQAELEAFPEASATARQLGFRTILSVPLLREGQAIGALQLRRTEVAAFSDKQIALLQTFADQAVIAIENVRLFKELEEKNRALTTAHAQVTESLEQQTATSEILKVISRSPTDVQPVFETIADSAMRLCGAWSVAVYPFDGELVHVAVTRGGLPGSAEYLRQRYPMRPTPDAPTIPVRAIVERALVHVPDSELDDRGITRETGRARGFRAAIGVPMLRGGEPIGAIGVSRVEPGAFSLAQIEMLKTFADQAVIAIENVRLFTELQARTRDLTRSVEQLTALGEVSQALSSTLDLDAVLNTIVGRASQLAGTAGCSIYEYDEGAQRFELRAAHNYDAEFVEALRAAPLRKGEGLMGRATEMREPVQVPDIAVPGAYQSNVRDTLIRFGYRALMSVPLLREDQIIGSLSFNRKAPGEFPPEVVEVLKTFATQSALAIQNARLFRELADKSRQLEVASQHKSEFLANMSHELRTPLNAIIGFSEVLTERMFGELNEKQDEYLKDIYASGTHLLSLINDILDLSKIEAGRMELELTDFDLPTAIDNALMLVRERAGRRGIALQQSVEEHLGEIRGDERKVKQVLLNLLSNALKFTPEGGRVEVLARVVDSMAEISVTDTGVGIAPEDQEAVFEEFRQVGTAEKKVEGTGLGLALCRKFVELHGGRIWVKSQVGVGSTFSFTLPIHRGQ